VCLGEVGFVGSEREGLVIVGCRPGLGWGCGQVGGVPWDGNTDDCCCFEEGSPKLSRLRSAQSFWFGD
jgi:hypothetical protein